MKILRCEKCNSYTLKEICPYCKGKTFEPKPAKFSLKKNYSKYRIPLRYKNV
ncbi:MAG: nucleolar RNA-binding Nop10p family protein [Candidatus Altiarchaeota archaeon]